MRVMREYFGVDRTTVTYEHQITGVGGNTDEFFVLCEAGRQAGHAAVRTTVHFTHEEMAHLLADYRRNHPIQGTRQPFLLPGPHTAWRGRLKRAVARFLQRWRPAL
jgi:hypothetical protein